VEIRSEGPTLVDWMCENIFPHEQSVRQWLRRSRIGNREDDVIQEAYCRLAGLPNPCSIAAPRAYFFQVARNILLEQVRRDRIVRIESVAEIERLSIIDHAPSPERQVSDRDEMARVAQFISELPARRRTIFVMRKVEGLSQKVIAERVGVTENVVEKEIAAGLRDLLKAMSESSMVWATDRPARGMNVKRNERISRNR